MPDKVKVIVLKKPDDPQGIVRLSIGGVESLGYYCTFRGDIAVARRALTLAHAGLLLAQANNFDMQRFLIEL